MDALELFKHRQFFYKFMITKWLIDFYKKKLLNRILNFKFWYLKAKNH